MSIKSAVKALYRPFQDKKAEENWVRETEKSWENTVLCQSIAFWAGRCGYTSAVVVLDGAHAALAKKIAAALAPLFPTVVGSADKLPEDKSCLVLLDKRMHALDNACRHAGLACLDVRYAYRIADMREQQNTLPPVLNTVENGFADIAVVCREGNALAEDCLAYLRKNPGLQVREVTPGEWQSREDGYHAAVSAELFLVLDFSAPGTVYGPDGTVQQTLFWREFLEGRMTIGDGDRDIRETLVPQLAAHGVKVLWLGRPQLDKLAAGSAVRRRMRFSRLYRRFSRMGFAHWRHRIFGVESCWDGLHQVRADHSKGYVECFGNSEGVHYDGGFRRTIGTPIKAQNRIWAYGPCVVRGPWAVDADTIPSRLQALAGEQYAVVNRGDQYNTIATLIRTTDFRPGDIVVVFGYSMLQWELPGAVSVYTTPALAAVPRVEKHVSDDPYHCDGVLNDALAAFIWQQLQAHDFLQKPETPGPEFSFGPAQKQPPAPEMVADAQFLQYLQSLAPYARPGKSGGIVMNCNPFTLGHRYLIETAAAQVDNLFVFVVEEDKSVFPFADRLRLVREGTADLPNVRVLPSGRYMISSQTLPGYFEKDSLGDIKLDASADLLLFVQIARQLHIEVRFAGEEPLDPFTAQYNANMQEILPRYGLQFAVIPRKEQQGAPISASRVRKLLQAGQWAQLRPLVPDTTYCYLREKFAADAKK